MFVIADSRQQTILEKVVVAELVQNFPTFHGTVSCDSDPKHVNRLGGQHVGFCSVKGVTYHNHPA